MVYIDLSGDLDETGIGWLTLADSIPQDLET